MITCSSCSSSVPEDGRFCPRCGAAVAPSSEAPTVLASRAGGLSPAGGRSSSSSDPLDAGHFTAGTVLAGRYRIIGLLGRGGMGEVYRADDLTLGQPVALKFLPEALAREPGRLARFHAEVRIARQISHPNVCRVYDIGEVDGQRFLTMEYVDGEDLASLLRRIGRFSPDKAVEIARQICAGLAAAHERGVVHRDFKPANVMIDGRGKVRITDFGLAGLAADLKAGEARVGTPAYMAPEQLSGREVSVRSDLYALGLVLYEMFTGKRAFKAASGAEMMRSHGEEPPVSPSSHVPDLDPAAERAILRCLERDPGARPASALAVAAALPGGDPLAAALAAGETPAPEVVAAAGEQGGLRPTVARVCLGMALLGIALLAYLAGELKLTGRVPLEKPPDVLADRSRAILQKLGHTAPVADSAYGFSVDRDYIRHVRERDPSPSRWDGLASGRPAAVTFWYRESPRPMVGWPGITRVALEDPPQVLPGMASVVLDTRGRLLEFQAVPPRVDSAVAPPASPDWSLLFAEAGLDLQDFRPAEPTWIPPLYADSRAAWEGSFPERPDLRIRLEAGGYQGRTVYFRILAPWNQPERLDPDALTSGQKVARNIGFVVAMGCLTGALVLARRNLRLGRGDRAGAFKVACFFLAVHLLVWAFWAHHVAEPFEEWQIFILDTGYTLFLATLLWLLYVSLEPLVRRRWPDTIISWSRVLAGRWRDPLVGRDVLIGSLAGIGVLCLQAVGKSAPGWMGWPPSAPDLGGVENLVGWSYSAVQVLDISVHAVLNAMTVLFLFLLFRILFRRQWLAAGVFVALLMTLAALQEDHRVIAALVGGALGASLTYLLIRFGLLATTVAMAFPNFANMLLTTHLTAWYAGSTILALLACTAIACYGFYTSLAGQPIFGGGLLEEG